MRPQPTERALKTDTMSILAVYQQYYSNTNQCRTSIIECIKKTIKIVIMACNKIEQPAVDFHNTELSPSYCKNWCRQCINCLPAFMFFSTKHQLLVCTRDPVE